MVIWWFNIAMCGAWTGHDDDYYVKPNNSNQKYVYKMIMSQENIIRVYKS